MNEQRYNGHANYETWATCLWLDNDEGSYRHWRETARDILRRQPPSEEGLHQARIAFAKELQERNGRGSIGRGQSVYGLAASSDQ